MMRLSVFRCSVQGSAQLRRARTMVTRPIIRNRCSRGLRRRSLLLEPVNQAHRNGTLRSPRQGAWYGHGRAARFRGTAAYFEVVSDMFGSVRVIVGSLAHHVAEAGFSPTIIGAGP